MNNKKLYNRESYYNNVEKVNNKVKVLKQEFIKEFGDIKLTNETMFNTRTVNCFTHSRNKAAFKTVADIINWHDQHGNLHALFRVSRLGRSSICNIIKTINNIAGFEILATYQQ